MPLSDRPGVKKGGEAESLVKRSRRRRGKARGKMSPSFSFLFRWVATWNPKNWSQRTDWPHRLVGERRHPRRLHHRAVRDSLKEDASLRSPFPEPVALLPRGSAPSVIVNVVYKSESNPFYHTVEHCFAFGIRSRDQILKSEEPLSCNFDAKGSQNFATTSE